MFIEDRQLIDDAKALGFDGELLYTMLDDTFNTGRVSLRAKGYTLEQLERWLFDKYSIWISHSKFQGEFWRSVHIEKDIINSVDSSNPFSARLEGVKKVIEYLKEGSK
jgi:hypothetical protein